MFLGKQSCQVHPGARQMIDGSAMSEMGQTLPFACVEPRASFTLHQQTFATTIKSSHSGQCCRHQIAFGFLEKIRKWADRDRSPQTQRRCRMAEW